MNQKANGNDLRAHRRRSGLTQRELGMLIGYDTEWQVSRHELSKTIPPLLIALAYEEVFGRPISAIFAGFQSAVAASVSQNFQKFQGELERAHGMAPKSKIIKQKLQWVTERAAGKKS